MKMPDWEESFKYSDLGDKRRVKRAIKLSKQIDSKCEKSGASALLSGHAELKAVSRLLNSPKVTPESLTDGFMKINCERLTAPHVLVVEDTSELNFVWRKKEIKGLGPAGNRVGQGFFIHPSIVVEPVKNELQGIASLSVITRQHGLKTTENDSYRHKDITEKESYRWIEVPRKGIERIPSWIKKTIVADREADIYDLFLAQQNGDLGKNSELLIRACRNRKIVGAKNKYLYDEIDSWDSQGTYNIEIPGNGNRERRETKCLIRFGEVNFDIPTRQRKRGKLGSVFVVDVKEVDTDGMESPLHWKLLTTWPVSTFDEAVEKIEWYRNRWLIEELFRVLKSGYKVESVRFDSGKALINWCALRLLMAVKLMYIRTHRDDESPDSARDIFSNVELEVLERCESKLISSNSKIHRPEKFSMAWASLLVAIMGGYQALPSAKPFGQTTLWRGLITLENAVMGYRAASSP